MKLEEYKIMYAQEDRHWWYVALHELILNSIFRDKSDIRILDAGCGTGRLLQLLQSCATAVGCDASDIALQRCAQRGTTAFKLDLNKDGLELRGFDVITLIDVLYHREVKNEETVLRSIYAALRPGGRLILQVPAYEWLRSSHDAAVHTARRYTKKRIRRIVQACGFQIEKATYRVSILFLPIAIMKLGKKVSPWSHTGASDLREHSAALNRWLLAVMRVENWLLEHMTLPFGTSVFLIAQRPDDVATVDKKGPK